MNDVCLHINVLPFRSEIVVLVIWFSIHHSFDIKQSISRLILHSVEWIQLWNNARYVNAQGGVKVKLYRAIVDMRQRVTNCSVFKRLVSLTLWWQCGMAVPGSKYRSPHCPAHQLLSSHASLTLWVTKIILLCF